MQACRGIGHRSFITKVLHVQVYWTPPYIEFPRNLNSGLIIIAKGYSTPVQCRNFQALLATLSYGKIGSCDSYSKLSGQSWWCKTMHELFVITYLAENSRPTRQLCSGWIDLGHAWPGSHWCWTQAHARLFTKESRETRELNSQQAGTINEWLIVSISMILRKCALSVVCWLGIAQSSVFQASRIILESQLGNYNLLPHLINALLDFNWELLLSLTWLPTILAHSIN